MTPARVLGKILWEELDREGWGDISPHWFNVPDDMEEEDYDDAEQFAAMEEVLERVVDRLKREL